MVQTNRAVNGDFVEECLVDVTEVRQKDLYKQQNHYDLLSQTSLYHIETMKVSIIAQSLISFGSNHTLLGVLSLLINVVQLTIYGQQQNWARTSKQVSRGSKLNIANSWVKIMWCLYNILTKNMKFFEKL